MQIPIQRRPHIVLIDSGNARRMLQLVAEFDRSSEAKARLFTEGTWTKEAHDRLECRQLDVAYRLAGVVGGSVRL